MTVRPPLFGVYTAEELWADPHISEKMLAAHLDGNVAAASRTSDFIARSLSWLESYAHIGPGTTILDLGCGPGLYANELAARGAHVVGVDVSGRSLRHARSSAPTGRAQPTYLQGNYLSVDIPGQYEVVLLAHCDYCALSPPQRRVLLTRIRSLLHPGGTFIFDVNGLALMRERREGTTSEPDLMNGFWSAEPYHGVMVTFIYEAERVVLDRYEIVEAHQTRTIYNWFQCFDVPAIERELVASGLALRATFGDLTGAAMPADPIEFGVIATLREEEGGVRRGVRPPPGP